MYKSEDRLLSHGYSVYAKVITNVKFKYINQQNAKVTPKGAENLKLSDIIRF